GSFGESPAATRKSDSPYRRSCSITATVTVKVSAASARTHRGDMLYRAARRTRSTSGIPAAASATHSPGMDEFSATAAARPPVRGRTGPEGVRMTMPGDSDIFLVVFDTYGGSYGTGPFELRLRLFAVSMAASRQSALSGTALAIAVVVLVIVASAVRLDLVEDRSDHSRAGATEQL